MTNEINPQKEVKEALEQSPRIEKGLSPTIWIGLKILFALIFAGAAAFFLFTSYVSSLPLVLIITGAATLTSMAPILTAIALIVVAAAMGFGAIVLLNYSLKSKKNDDEPIHLDDELPSVHADEDSKNQHEELPLSATTSSAASARAALGRPETLSRADNQKFMEDSKLVEGLIAQMRPIKATEGSQPRLELSSGLGQLEEIFRKTPNCYRLMTFMDTKRSFTRTYLNSLLACVQSIMPASKERDEILLRILKSISGLTALEFLEFLNEEDIPLGETLLNALLADDEDILYQPMPEGNNRTLLEVAIREKNWQPMTGFLLNRMTKISIGVFNNAFKEYFPVIEAIFERQNLKLPGSLELLKSLVQHYREDAETMNFAFELFNRWLQDLGWKAPFGDSDHESKSSEKAEDEELVEVLKGAISNVDFPVSWLETLLTLPLPQDEIAVHELFYIAASTQQKRANIVIETLKQRFLPNNRALLVSLFDENVESFYNNIWRFVKDENIAKFLDLAEEMGASIDLLVEQPNGFTLMHRAIMYNNFELVERLLGKATDIEVLAKIMASRAKITSYSAPTINLIDFAMQCLIRGLNDKDPKIAEELARRNSSLGELAAPLRIIPISDFDQDFKRGSCFKATELIRHPDFKLRFTYPSEAEILCSFVRYYKRCPSQYFGTGALVEETDAMTVLNHLLQRICSLSSESDSSDDQKAISTEKSKPPIKVDGAFAEALNAAILLSPDLKNTLPLNFQLFKQLFTCYPLDGFSYHLSPDVFLELVRQSCLEKLICVLDALRKDPQYLKHSVTYLLQADVHGETPLDIASTPDIIRELIRFSLENDEAIDIERRDANGHTLIHRAVIHNDVKLVEELLAGAEGDALAKPMSVFSVSVLRYGHQSKQELNLIDFAIEYLRGSSSYISTDPKIIDVLAAHNAKLGPKAAALSLVPIDKFDQDFKMGQFFELDKLRADAIGLKKRFPPAAEILRSFLRYYKRCPGINTSSLYSQQATSSQESDSLARLDFILQKLGCFYGPDFTELKEGDEKRMVTVNEPIAEALDAAILDSFAFQNWNHLPDVLFKRLFTCCIWQNLANHLSTDAFLKLAGESLSKRLKWVLEALEKDAEYLIGPKTSRFRRLLTEDAKGQSPLSAATASWTIRKLIDLACEAHLKIDAKKRDANGHTLIHRTIICNDINLLNYVLSKVDIRDLRVVIEERHDVLVGSETGASGKLKMDLIGFATLYYRPTLGEDSLQIQTEFQAAQTMPANTWSQVNRTNPKIIACLQKEKEKLLSEATSLAAATSSRVAGGGPLASASLAPISMAGPIAKPRPAARPCPNAAAPASIDSGPK